MSRLQSLELQGIRLGFPRQGGSVRWILEGVDLRLLRGETCSLLGRSGEGKTVLSRLLIGLAPCGCLAEGTLVWTDDAGTHRADLSRDLTGDPAEVPLLSSRWGRSIAYVPQGGVRNLNPAQTIHTHIARARKRAGLEPDRDAELALLAEVGFADPMRVWTRRPLALSGGMARRVLLALALAGAPDVLVVDEPTTGLDTERRDRAIERLREARRNHGFGLLMVTHEVGDAARLTAVGCVLAGARIVERLEFGEDELRCDPETAAARELVDAWRWTGWGASP
jgi:peptide/nickel transport system permease protein